MRDKRITKQFVPPEWFGPYYSPPIVGDFVRGLDSMIISAHTIDVQQHMSEIVVIIASDGRLLLYYMINLFSSAPQVEMLCFLGSPR
uniref:Uncharacterized protein n=1 Tax=Arion vulgaris TaxID=1028688 RepID=A0A0B7BHK4_9EUPU